MADQNRFSRFVARELDVIVTALYNLPTGNIAGTQYDDLIALRDEALTAYNRVNLTRVEG